MDKAETDGIKLGFAMQRFIVTKGNTCSIFRSVMAINEKGEVKKQKISLYKITSQIRYDGDEQEKDKFALNEKSIKDIIFTKIQFNSLKKTIN